MRTFWLALTVLGWIGMLSNAANAADAADAADAARSFAAAAREVGREQGMPDAATPVPERLPKLPVPTSGEGFYPVWDGRKNNPYFENLVGWCDGLLRKKPVFYGPSTPDRKVYTGTGGGNPNYWTRTEPAIAQNLFWLCMHPQSPYYGNPEVFRRMLRRALSYANDYNHHAGKYQDYWNDFFAIGPELYLLRMLRDTCSPYLLPSQRTAIDDCVKKAGAFWLKTFEAMKQDRFPGGHYANRDLGIANILLNAGLGLKRPEMLRGAEFLVSAQRKNQYPDGGFAYIGTQNESPGYHQADVEFLTRYLASTGDERIAELLKNSRNCSLLGNEPGGVAETWTAAPWKHMWNGSNYRSAESVAYYSGDGFLRRELDGEIARNGRRMSDALHIPFYRDAVKPLEKPHDYTVRDRNIDGVRARYGLWSAAWTLRAPADREPGPATLAGALTLDREGENLRMNSAMMFARPAAQIGKSPRNPRDRAFLAHGLTSDRAGGRDWSAFGADYRLQVFRSSSPGPVTELRGGQVWLTVRDRMYGLLTVEAPVVTAAGELAAEIRLGYGGFRDSKREKTMRTEDGKTYVYGKFRLRVLDTNFPNVEIRRNPVRTAEACDLTFFATPGPDGKFPAGTRYYAAFELVPDDSSAVGGAAEADGRTGTIRAAADGRKYEVRYDRAAHRLNVVTDDRSLPWKNFDELLDSRR